jgi:hypothetical protein
MAMIAAWLKIDEERVAQELQEAAEKLDSAEDEVVLDFSCVKVLLCGVNVDVYRVLTLVRLTSRFSFVN